MAHKTLVGGTAYDISGGKTLVGGTGYDIAKGRTLVGGTGYDISFFPPIGTPLNDLTWEQIRKISDDGLAGSYFSVGDTKSIIINGTVGNATFSNLSVDVFIIGIDHNADIEGKNRIHFQIGKINGIDVALVNGYGTSVSAAEGYFNMGSSSGGWIGSNVRNAILGNGSTPGSPADGSLLAALPADLLDVMKPVTKYSDNVGDATGNAGNVTPTEDYLTLLSEFEYRGVRYYANNAEQNYQKRYEYYALENSRIKYKTSDINTAAIHWTRSIVDTYETYYCFISESGASGGKHGHYSYGIAPMFCV